MLGHTKLSHSAMFVFSSFYFGCFLKEICVSLRRSRLFLESCLYRGGVTKSGPGPSGFSSVHSSWAVTHMLWQGHCSALRWELHRGVDLVSARVNRPGVCEYITATLPDVGSARERPGHIFFCVHYIPKQAPNRPYIFYRLLILFEALVVFLR